MSCLIRSYEVQCTRMHNRLLRGKEDYAEYLIYLYTYLRYKRPHIKKKMVAYEVEIIFPTPPSQRRPIRVFATDNEALD